MDLYEPPYTVGWITRPQLYLKNLEEGAMRGAQTSATFLTISLTMSFVAACNTLDYQEPKLGQAPVARVRFVTTSEAIAVLRVYDDPNCERNEMEWMRLRVGDLLNSTPKSLGMPLWNYNPNAAKEVYVVANKTLNGLLFGSEIRGATTYSCGTPFSFSFSEGHDYEVTFQWQPQECQVSISEILPQGRGWTRSEVARFYNVVNETNRVCLDRFKEQRLF